MSENTPERLKEFREQYRENARGSKTARVLKPLLLVAAVALGLWGAQVFLRSALASSATRSGGMSPEQWRSYAVYLEGKDLPAESLHAYEHYIEIAPLTDAERAKVCFAMGSLAADIEDYQKALAYLYQSEMLAPESEMKPDIDKKVVMCLDRLGRTTDLRRELRNRSGAQHSVADVGPNETVIAEYGNVVFTDRDLEQELQKLPPVSRARLDSPDAKADFVRNLIARRLMVDKALRRELDKDPAIEKQLVAQRDALLVQRLVDDRLKGQPEPTTDDLKQYYKANSDRFKSADADEAPPFEQVRDRVARMMKAQAVQDAVNQLISDTLDERGVKFYPDRLSPQKEEDAQ